MCVLAIDLRGVNKSLALIVVVHVKPVGRIGGTCIQFELGGALLSFGGHAEERHEKRDHEDARSLSHNRLAHEAKRTQVAPIF